MSVFYANCFSAIYFYNVVDKNPKLFIVFFLCVFIHLLYSIENIFYQKIRVFDIILCHY